MNAHIAFHTGLALSAQNCATKNAHTSQKDPFLTQVLVETVLGQWNLIGQKGMQNLVEFSVMICEHLMKEVTIDSLLCRWSACSNSKNAQF